MRDTSPRMSVFRYDPDILCVRMHVVVKLSLSNNYK
jgi:hypothetical protein